jgi:hypothetical protein
MDIGESRGIWPAVGKEFHSVSSDSVEEQRFHVRQFVPTGLTGIPSFSDCNRERVKRVTNIGGRNENVRPEDARRIHVTDCYAVTMSGLGAVDRCY